MNYFFNMGEQELLFAEKFAEYVYENHYVICNVEMNIYYWRNEDYEKSTSELMMDYLEYLELWKKQTKE
jgi:hypothetical protein